MIGYMYVVHSDTDDQNLYREFDDKEEALDYARHNFEDETTVFEVELELNEDGEVVDELGSELIWSYDFE